MKRSVMTLLTLSAFFILTKPVSAQETYPVLREAQYQEPVLASGILKSYKTFVLDEDVLKRLKSDAPEELALSIPSPEGGFFDVKLQKKDLFTADFAVQTPGGKVENLDLGIHYTGKLANDPRSLTAFSFYNNCMFGMVATDAGNFNVVFLRDADKNPTNRYVVYNDAAITTANPFHCSTDELPTVPRNTQKSGTDDDRAATCKTLRQYYECDYQMFLDNGGSVQNTTSWTLAMFNVVNYLYHNEQISFRVSEVFVWDHADNYPPAAGDALNAFGDTRQDNFNGDLAHFLTTKNLNNGGLAWVDVLCQDYWAQYSYGRFAYSNIDDSYLNLPLWSWTINCVTHETGHNLGSNHTHWCGWELSPGHFGAIDSCYATEANDGVQCYTGPVKPIKGTIMSYCHLGLGTNLNLGFGPLPGNLIRQRVQQAACIAAGSGPEAPVVTGNTQYCVGEPIQLTATYSGGPFSWSGPNAFTSTEASIHIADAVLADAGVYMATITSGDCVISEFVNVQVTAKPPTPQITVTGGNTLKCIPSATAYTYQWYTVDGTPVGNNTATFQPNISGEYYVVISKNGCSSTQSVKYNFSHLASVSEQAGNAGLAVWPNPASGQVFVDFSGVAPQANLAVYDLSGRLLVKQNSVTAGQTPTSVDVSTLSDGMYILEIDTKGHIERAKFMVKN